MIQAGRGTLDRYNAGSAGSRNVNIKNLFMLIKISRFEVNYVARFCIVIKLSSGKYIFSNLCVGVGIVRMKYNLHYRREYLPYLNALIIIGPGALSFPRPT